VQPKTRLLAPWWRNCSVLCRALFTAFIIAHVPYRRRIWQLKILFLLFPMCLTWRISLPFRGAFASHGIGECPAWHSGAIILLRGHRSRDVNKGSEWLSGWGSRVPAPMYSLTNVAPWYLWHMCSITKQGSCKGQGPLVTWPGREWQRK
jgi:hypothetical protein